MLAHGDVGVVIVFQVIPASVVRHSLLPAASASVLENPCVVKSDVAPAHGVCGVHVSPPSVVARRTGGSLVSAPLPTIQPLEELPKSASYSVAVPRRRSHCGRNAVMAAPSPSRWLTDRRAVSFEDPNATWHALEIAEDDTASDPSDMVGQPVASIDELDRTVAPTDVDCVAAVAPPADIAPETTTSDASTTTNKGGNRNVT